MTSSHTVRRSIDLDRADQAARALRRVIQLDQQHLEGWYVLGGAMARLRRYNEAVAAWERLIHLAPASPLAQRAREHVRTALDLHWPHTGFSAVALV